MRVPTADWAFEQLGIGRWSRDVRTGALTWDAAMVEITGHASPLDLDAWAERLVHPQERVVMAKIARKAADNGAFDIPSLRIVRPNGEARWLRMSGRPGAVDDGTAHLYLGVAFDITDQVVLQRRLAEAERLEMLGRFSAGVSHNFNNMLMVIAACLNLLRARLSNADDPGTEQVLDDAEEATRRAAEVVAQIAQLTRINASESTQRVSVSELCQTVARLARHGLPPAVAFDVEIVDDAAIDVAPGSLEQVLQNLINNARDALLAAGSSAPRITLSTKNSENTETRWVDIVVTDNGPGVDPAIVEQLFEPFVTTKGREGTGLGLASSSAIVQRSGGHLAYRPGEAGGAEFLVSLPAFERTGGLSSAPVRVEAEPVDISRVLLIENEPAIVRAVTVALKRRGLFMASASSRAEVEAVLGADDASFDVVLLDYSLGPEQGGDLVSVLRARLPDARILFFTGEPLSPEQSDVADGVVHKPVDLEQLFSTLRRPG